MILNKNLLLNVPVNVSFVFYTFKYQNFKYYILISLKNTKYNFLIFCGLPLLFALFLCINIPEKYLLQQRLKVEGQRTSDIWRAIENHKRTESFYCISEALGITEIDGSEKSAHLGYLNNLVIQKLLSVIK